MLYLGDSYDRAKEFQVWDHFLVLKPCTFPRFQDSGLKIWTNPGQTFFLIWGDHLFLNYIFWGAVVVD